MLIMMIQDADEREANSCADMLDSWMDGGMVGIKFLIWRLV
jgi:hypothetical protein